jgi:hypothetical protein
MSHANPTIEEANAYAASYIKKNCMTTAFLAAFPNTRMTGHNLNTKASKFHQLVEIQSRIADLHEAAKKRAEEDHGITVASQLKKLEEISRLGMKNKVVFIDGVPVPPDEIECGDPVNLNAAVSATAEQNKILGLHAAEKRQISGDKNNPLDVKFTVEFVD